MARKSLANAASVDVLGSRQEDLAATASFVVHRSACMGLKVSQIPGNDVLLALFCDEKFGRLLK